MNNEEKLKGIDAAIRGYYAVGSSLVSEDLVEAIFYSVDAGGKRIRPLILLDLLEGFGIDLCQAHFDVAAAVEMIHTGSLIHDDLPAMDDDDYRRGRLTSHKQFDEATAILAGDSLFLDSFGLLAQAGLPAAITVRLVQTLSAMSGTFGMVGGQMLDMKSEGQELDALALSAIHVNKTGKLLAYPFMAAGMIAAKSEAVIERLCQAGHLVGHAFQVRDDILDVTASFEDLGKTPKKDLRSEKLTYPSLLGLADSYRILNDSLDQARAIFKELQETEDFVPEQVYQLIERLRLHD